MSPRPILKRAPATDSPTKSHRGVRFPPSPKLTRTHTTHSPAAYDRSPIVVAPNACALPARGCPGKTFRPGESPVPHNTHPGRHLHPRAVAAAAAAAASDRPTGIGLHGLPRNRDIGDPERTPAHPSHQQPSTQYFPVPPLIPDLSSESDESDGFCSPPALQSSFSSSSSCQSTPRSSCISIPPSAPGSLTMNLSYDAYPPTPTPTPAALSFLPHPPSPPQLEKDRTRRRRTRLAHREDGAGDEDEEPRSYRPFSARICSLAEKDEGCLAGF